MWINRVLLFTLLFFFSGTVSIFAQNKKMQRQMKRSGGLHVIKETTKGWYGGLGGTYMYPYPKDEGTYRKETNLLLFQQSESAFHSTQPKGKIGAYGELGLFRINQKKIINYFDLGIAYKMFRLEQNYEQFNAVNDLPTDTFTNSLTVTDHNASLHFNIGNVHKNSTGKLWVLNALGLNADFTVAGKRENENALYPFQRDVEPNKLLGQLHYLFGLGFKVSERIVAMPILEMPVLALFPFDQPHISTHQYQNNYYRPIILRVRIFILNKKNSCPPVYNPMGMDPNKQLEK